MWRVRCSRQRDIVVHWAAFKASNDVLNPILVQCFQLTASHPITLLTATAQLETSPTSIETGDLVVLPSYKQAISRTPEMGALNENNVLRAAFAAIGWQALSLDELARSLGIPRDL